MRTFPVKQAQDYADALRRLIKALDKPASAGGAGAVTALAQGADWDKTVSAWHAEIGSAVKAARVALLAAYPDCPASWTACTRLVGWNCSATDGWTAYGDVDAIKRAVAEVKDAAERAGLEPGPDTNAGPVPPVDWKWPGLPMNLEHLAKALIEHEGREVSAYDLAKKLPGEPSRLANDHRKRWGEWIEKHIGHKHGIYWWKGKLTPAK
jgi:hypothetical protein